MIFGLNFFVLPKITSQDAFRNSLAYGATFGFIVFGIYDFTAGGVFKKWDWPLAFLDVLWGTFVFFISSLISSILAS